MAKHSTQEIQQQPLPDALQLKFILQRRDLVELQAFNPKVLANTHIKIYGRTAAPFAHFAFLYGNQGWAEAVDYLISLHKEHKILAQPDVDGLHIIHRLAREPEFHTRITQLLDAGISINTPDASGMTALHHAVDSNNPEAVKFLIEHGASLTAKTNTGWTPLHIAAQDGNKDIIATLLGANKALYKVKDNSNKTPVHVSLQYGGGVLATYLSIPAQRTRHLNEMVERRDAIVKIKKKDRMPEQQSFVMHFGRHLVDEFKPQKIQWKLGQDTEGYTVIHSAILGNLSQEQFAVLYQERPEAFRKNKTRDFAEEYLAFAKQHGCKAIASYIRETIIPERGARQAEQEAKARSKAEKSKEADASTSSSQEADVPVRKRSATMLDTSTSPSPSSSGGDEIATPKKGVLAKFTGLFKSPSSRTLGRASDTVAEPSHTDKEPLLPARSRANTVLESKKSKRQTEKAPRTRGESFTSLVASPSADRLVSRQEKKTPSSPDKEKISFIEFLAESSSSSEEKSSSSR